jgi:hypothetical protein
MVIERSPFITSALSPCFQSSSRAQEIQATSLLADGNLQQYTATMDGNGAERTAREPEDGVEFEVSILDGSARAAHTAREIATTAKQRQTFATNPPGMRLSPLRRSLAGVTALASTLLAILILIVSIPSADATLRWALHLPTPVPTKAPPRGSDMLLLAHTVPWGRLTIDGQSLDDLHLPIDQIDGYPVIRLSPGAHALSYSADQFPPMTCVVSIPVTPPRTTPADDRQRACDLLPFPNIRAPVDLPAAHLIDLHATVDRLTAATLARLTDAVNATLPSVGTTVQPGERYLGPDGRVRIAMSSLVASLVIHLNTNPSFGIALGEAETTCVVICADLLQSATPTESPAWSLYANVAPEWRFTTPEGEFVAPFAAPSGASTNALFQLVTVEVTDERGQLRAGPRGTESASRLIFSAASTVIRSYSNMFAAQYPAGWNALPFMARNPADGCMILVGSAQPTGGIPSGKTLNVLYQFGVLLAANDLAHTVLPELPVATAADLDRWSSVA